MLIYPGQQQPVVNKYFILFWEHKHKQPPRSNSQASSYFQGIPSTVARSISREPVPLENCLDNNTDKASLGSSVYVVSVEIYLSECLFIQDGRWPEVYFQAEEIEYETFGGSLQ